MNCPTCKREYGLGDFDRDETYFECHDCACALELDDSDRQELKLEAFRKAASDLPPSRATGGVLTRNHRARSMWPAYLWVAALSIYWLIGAGMGVAFIVKGSVGAGIVAIAIWTVLLGPSIVGVLLRKRFGLYATYLIMGIVLIFSAISGFRPERSSPGYVVGTILGAILWGGLFFLWMRWFWRNRDLFGTAIAQDSGATHEDIYTSRLDRGAPGGSPAEDRNHER